MLLSSSQPLTSSFSNGIKKTTWLIAPDIVLGRNLFSVGTAPLHPPAAPSLSTEKGQVSFGASVGIVTFFTTLKEKKRQELLQSSSFSLLAAFVKAHSNCCHLEVFPHMEDEVKQGVRRDRIYGLLGAKAASVLGVTWCHVSLRHFKGENPIWYAPHPWGLSWSSWINREKHLWTWGSHRFVTLHLKATQTQRKASIGATAFSRSVIYLQIK